MQRLPALRSPRTRARTLTNCARSKGATPSSLGTMGGLKRVLENLRAQAGPDGPNLADSNYWRGETPCLRLGILHPPPQRAPRRRSAHIAAQVWHKCATSAAQVRHKCGTSATQVRHKFGTSAAQVRHKCGASAEQVWSTVRIARGTPADVRRGVFWQKHPPKNTKHPQKHKNTKKDGGKHPFFFSPSGLFAGTREDSLRKGGRGNYGQCFCTCTLVAAL